jgi:hypothetical protein
VPQVHNAIKIIFPCHCAHHPESQPGTITIHEISHALRNMRFALEPQLQATSPDLREFAYHAASVAITVLSLNEVTINYTRMVADIAIHMALDAFNAPSAEHIANMHDKLLTIITSCYLFDQYLPAHFEIVETPFVFEFEHGDHVMTDVAHMESDSDTSHPQVTLGGLDTQTHEGAPQILRLNVETQTSTESNDTLASLVQAMQTILLDAGTQTLTTSQSYTPLLSLKDEYYLPATTLMSVSIATNTFLHADLVDFKFATGTTSNGTSTISANHYSRTTAQAHLHTSQQPHHTATATLKHSALASYNGWRRLEPWGCVSTSLHCPAHYCVPHPQSPETHLWGHTTQQRTTYTAHGASRILSGPR